MRDPQQHVGGGGRRLDRAPNTGVADKRLLAIESEFSSALRMLSRDGNVLSAVAREAWNSGDLRILTKNDPARATGAHISVIGHISGGTAAPVDHHRQAQWFRQSVPLLADELLEVGTPVSYAAECTNILHFYARVLVIRAREKGRRRQYTGIPDMVLLLHPGQSRGQVTSRCAWTARVLTSVA